MTTECFCLDHDSFTHDHSARYLTVVGELFVSVSLSLLFQNGNPGKNPVTSNYYLFGE